VDLTAVVQSLAKIDYVDGLGLAIGAHDVSLVHMSKRFLRVAVLQTYSAALPESGEERAVALEQALTQFAQDMQVTPEQVVLCVPRHLAFVSRLVIPETARGSLAQVIEYEIERLVPLPKEDLYFDYLTYEMGGEERRLGVVIMAIPRRVVDEYLAVAEKVQLLPQFVTVSSAALMSAATFCGAVAEGPGMVAAQDDGAIELNFIEKNHLVASHVFPRAQAANADVLSDLILQGVARNFPGVPIEETSLFALPMPEAAFPFPIDAEHDLHSLVRARFAGTAVDFLPAVGVPALGAGLQAVGEDAVGINLLPQEKRARREKKISPLTLGLMMIVLLLAVLWPISVVVQQHRVLRTLAAQRAALEPNVQQVQKQETEVNRLLERLKVVDESSRKRIVPLLKNLSEEIPADVYMTSFSYKEAGNTVDVSGVAAATRPASELVGLLENSPCLRNVAPKAPFTKTNQGETFTLGAQVEPCA
jgi:Tfp pilus assembly protein PilN